jgi:hypothetical protein
LIAWRLVEAEILSSTAVGFNPPSPPRCNQFRRPTARGRMAGLLPGGDRVSPELFAVGVTAAGLRHRLGLLAGEKALILHEAAIRPGTGRLPNFLQDQLGSEAFGTTGYAAVRPRNLLKAKIPLPPLAEQRRIVASVEAVASRVAEGRQPRDRARRGHPLRGRGVGHRPTPARRSGRRRLVPGAGDRPGGCQSPPRRPTGDRPHAPSHRPLGERRAGLFRVSRAGRDRP